MTVHELKDAVEAYRHDSKNKSGKVVSFSEAGPVGMSLIDSVVSVLQTQQKRIEDLERQIGK